MAPAVMAIAITADTTSRTRPGEDAKLRSDPTAISRYTTTSANPPNVDPQANSGK